MKKIVFLSILFLLSFYADAQERPTQGQATRYGNLSVNEQNSLLFNGKPVEPAIQGNNSLMIVDIFQVGDDDVALIQDNGGSGCPAQYQFVTVSVAGLDQSPVFGTCSELDKTGREGNAILVTMPGFIGPANPQEEREEAFREKHVFRFESGQVTENGKSVD